MLRIDPLDRTGTRVVGDLATSWTVSPDKRTYVLKLRRGVKFHDGSEMTSRDVRATYEKIINPPPGITSARKGEYLQIETVQAPEPYVVAFKLKWPSPSFIHSLASPWNWIYKADILERDVRWYETHIMGTGPFVFVEHVKGSHWVGRRNPEYWDRGKPYLDGYQALFIRDDAAQASAITLGRAHIQFRGFSPAQRDDIVRTLGDKITVQESPWNCGLVVAINHEKKPFHDRRVRRALSLALDRYQAAGALSKIAIVREVAGVQVPGSPFATPPAELSKLAGYWRDIREITVRGTTLAGRGRRCRGFSFVLKNRNIPMPYEYIGTWLVDQWRQIGLKVRHEIQESGQYFKDLRAGNFELSTDFQCGYVVDPDLDLYKFQSRGRSDANYGRYTDPVLDDLYVRPEPHGGSRATPAAHPRLRKAPPRRGGALHLHAPVAPYRAAQLPRARLDDNAEPLPQQSARHGVAGGVEGSSESDGYRPASSKASNRAVARAQSNCVVTKVWPSRAMRSRSAPSSTSRPSPRARASTSRRGATTAVRPSIA